MQRHSTSSGNLNQSVKSTLSKGVPFGGRTVFHPEMVRE